MKIENFIQKSLQLFYGKSYTKIFLTFRKVGMISYRFNLFHLRVFMGCILSFFIANNAAAWDWKKCKTPYNKEIEQCNEKHASNATKAWNDCFEAAQIKLYECRLSKSRFLPGKNKDTLKEALDQLNSQEKQAIEKCFALGKAGSKERVQCLVDFVNNNAESYLLSIYSHQIAETEK